MRMELHMIHVMTEYALQEISIWPDWRDRFIPVTFTFGSILINTQKKGLLEGMADESRGIEKHVVDPYNMKSTAFSGQMLAITSLQRIWFLFCINVQLHLCSVV